jgi:hypothetical protein
VPASADGNHRDSGIVLKPEDLRRTGGVHRQAEAEADPGSGPETHPPCRAGHDFLGVPYRGAEVGIRRGDAGGSRSGGEEVEVLQPLLAEEVEHQLLHVEADLGDHPSDLLLSRDRNRSCEILEALDVFGLDPRLIEAPSVEGRVLVLPRESLFHLPELELLHLGGVELRLDLHVPVSSLIVRHGLAPSPGSKSLVSRDGPSRSRDA